MKPRLTSQTESFSSTSLKHKRKMLPLWKLVAAFSVIKTPGLFYKSRTCCVSWLFWRDFGKIMECHLGELLLLWPYTWGKAKLKSFIYTYQTAFSLSDFSHKRCHQSLLSKCSQELFQRPWHRWHHCHLLPGRGFNTDFIHLLLQPKKPDRNSYFFPIFCFCSLLCCYKLQDYLLLLVEGHLLY